MKLCITQTTDETESVLTALADSLKNNTKYFVNKLQMKADKQNFQINPLI